MLCDEEDLGSYNSWGGLGGWKRKRGERSEKEKRKAGRWMGGRIGGCEYTVLRGVK